MLARSPRGRIALVVSLLATLGILIAFSPPPAGADPADPEGGSPALQTALANASRGYTAAKTKLVASQKRQAALVAQRKTLETNVAAASQDVEGIAVAAYTGDRVSMAASAVNSGSVQTFLDKLGLIEQLSWQSGRKIEAQRAARAALDDQQKKIDNEVRTQQSQERAMAKRKADAEKALEQVGGTESGGYRTTTASRAARSSPRNPDGSWPSESCSIDDPTSDGCLTPRMYHAYLEARAAGFTNYTHCFRQASFGEHGKGRACDFAANPTGFAGVATGSERDYGNRLAAWCVANADRLAVLYVIWYRQIWLPGTGWRAYSGDGTPAGDHMNHVHLSVQ